MRRFTSRPNPASRVAAFMCATSSPVDAQAVAHAVVAREVRRRLRRRDEVVRGDAVGRRRHRHRVDLGARRFQRRPPRRAPRRAPPARCRRSRSSRRRCRRATPTRPRRARRRASGAGRAIDVESQRVVTADRLEQQRGVLDRRRERPDLVERRRERDQPVARHDAVGRLHADHTAQRRGLADRAAGVGAQAPAARSPAATAAAEPPLEPPGTRVRSCGLRVGPNAEFSVEEPIANSSRLVLPTTTAPAARTRSTTVRVVRRTPAFEDARRARRRDARACTCCPSARAARPRAGPGSSPRATAASTASAAARASSASTTLNAWMSGSRAAIGREMLLDARRVPMRAPDRTSAAMPRAVLTAPPPGCAAPGTGAPAPRARPRALRRAAGPAAPRRAGRRSRAAAGARSAARRWCRAPRPAAAWSRIAPSSSVSDVDLLLAQREPGELRDVLDVGAGDPFGHRREATCRGRARLSGNSHHSSGAGLHSGSG